MDREPPRPELTFIVRVSRAADGQLRGMVERARTAEKQRFQGAAEITTIIERMAATATAEDEATWGTLSAIWPPVATCQSDAPAPVPRAQARGDVHCAPWITKLRGGS